jgi:2'-5' RNA ligase
MRIFFSWLSSRVSPDKCRNKVSNPALNSSDSRNKLARTMESDHPDDLLRLFVAIPIPEPVREEMIRVQRELQPLAPSGTVRWTRPDQFHLTLRFLGDVPVKAVDALKKSLAQACAGVRPFHLRARGVGFFPDVRSPRVLWVGIEDGENGLADLQARIGQASAPFADMPGADNFLAHATLGRFQKYRRHGTEKLLPHARLFEGHVFGDWRAENAGLFRSELSPDGARHAALAAFPLNAV